MTDFDDILDDDKELIKIEFLEAWHEAMTDAPTRSIWDTLRLIL
jgi:hypothetical protein